MLVLSGHAERIRHAIGFAVAGLLALGVLSNPVAAREASIIIDATTRQVLHADEPDARRYPASLTKIMTLYLAFEALDRGKLRLDQNLPVSTRAASQAPSSLGLRPGQTISVEDLMLAIATKSANDAAVTLAEGIAGTEEAFAQRMTAKALQLGMTNTVFRNASGLPNLQQHTTARDMAILALAVLQNHPKHYSIFATRQFTYKGRVYGNHNHLLGQYDGADGIKTGFINASGFNLVASVKRDNRRLIGVVFGGNTWRQRDLEMMQLLDSGFAGRFRGTDDIRTASISTPPASATPTAPAKTKRPTRETPTRVTASFNPIGTAEAAEAPPAPAKANTSKLTVASNTSTNNNSNNSWAVQVGAFGRSDVAEQQANRALEEFPGIFSGTQAMPLAVHDSNSKIYRARVAGLSEPEARDACRRLTQAQLKCLVVPPQG